MVKKKISFGIRIDKNTVNKLDKIIKANPEIKITRSELIESLINAFFATNFNHFEKGKEFVMIKRRKDIEDKI